MTSRPFVLIQFFVFLILSLSLFGDCMGQIYDFQKLIQKKETITVAHGKSINVAEESTWSHFGHSLRSGAEVLEFDLRLTKGESEGELSEDNCDFIIYHDPTFHGLSHGGYKTSPQKILEIQKLARPAPGGQIIEGEAKDPQDKRISDPNLYDRTFHYSRKTISGNNPEVSSNVFIYDPPSNSYVKPLFLDDMLRASDDPKKFSSPEYKISRDFREFKVPASQLELQNPPYYYLDLKEITQWGRNIENLYSWDIPMAQMKENDLIQHTALALKCLSKKLSDPVDSHQRTFTAIRHPCVGFLADVIDPKINSMISPDFLHANSPVEELIHELTRYGSRKACYECEDRLEKAFSGKVPPDVSGAPGTCDSYPENTQKTDCKGKYQLVEIKYLNHVKDPKLVEASQKYCWKIFYNQIEQTDGHQFIDRDRLDSGQRKKLEEISGYRPSPDLIPSSLETFKVIYPRLESLDFGGKNKVVQDYLRQEGVLATSKEGHQLLKAVFGQPPSPLSSATLKKWGFPLIPESKLVGDLKKIWKEGIMVQTNEVREVAETTKGIKGVSKTPAQILFLRDGFTIHKSGSLVKGGEVYLGFDFDRYAPKCPLISCFAQDGETLLEVSMNVEFNSNPRVFHSLSIKNMIPSRIDIPPEATQMKIWFVLKANRCKGGEAPVDKLLEFYDSNFGQNFSFDILPGSETGKVKD